MAANNSEADIRAQHSSVCDLERKIQSGWAVDTNLTARLQLYETFVDKNSVTENY